MHPITRYRTSAEPQISQAAFAKLMENAGFKATPGLISHWEQGRVVISAERAGEIETATCGAITRVDLRPDIFSPIDKAA